MRVYTIGVYGWSAEHFITQLKEEGVQMVVDTRQRRGVRGKEYRFANSKALQELLRQHGIIYRYIKALAPPVSIRQVQKQIDKAGQVRKRDRESLSDEYITQYEQFVLNRYDWSELEQLRESGIQKVALLCVERNPEACHRSLIARRLQKIYGAEVHHLTP
jgi:uncharacterized protein (DUF488 family)